MCTTVALRGHAGPDQAEPGQRRTGTFSGVDRVGERGVQQTVRNVVCSEWGEGTEVGAHNQLCDSLEIKLNGFILWALGNQDSL